MQQIRALTRLIDRLEEFMEEYKFDLDPDDMSAVDEVISIIDKIKNDLEEPEEEESAEAY